MLMQDLGFADRSTASMEQLVGTFDLAGEPPVNPDGVAEATNAVSQQRRGVAHRCFFQANSVSSMSRGRPAWPRPRAGCHTSVLAGKDRSSGRRSVPVHR